MNDKLNKLKIIIINILFLLVIILMIITLGILFKFKSINVELGSKIDIMDLVRFKGLDNQIKLITDIEDIDFNKIGKKDIYLKFLGKKYHLKINIIDSTAPKLVLKDVYSMIGYKFNIKDFIVSSFDHQKFSLEVKNQSNTNEYGAYPIEITATDLSGNKSISTTTLYIGWAVNEYYLEYGEKISKKDLIFDMKDEATISDKDIEKINQAKIGTYKIETIKGNNKKTINIIIGDKTGPTLESIDKTIYLGDKVSDPKEFINKIYDISGETNVKLLTNINYDILGEQVVKIEATDIYNNKTIKEVKLNIVEDKVGPVITGLSNIVANKNQTIDFKAGVNAIDERDGKCEFTYNVSAVNISNYGTYSIEYTSKDTSGNVTKQNRIITINHDMADTNAKIVSIAKNLSSNVETIRDYVRTIAYTTNWGGNDPIWFGLTNRNGNCYVHALIFKALLEQKGYQTKIIWTTDKSHYWNMVYLNNKWVHMDSTPTSRHTVYSIMNDQERLACLQGRTWDRSAWPVAK